MTPQREYNVERTLGRLETQMEHANSLLSEMKDQLVVASEERESMATDITALKDQAERMVVVTQQFNALQQAIRDGKMQGKGVLLGFGLATAAGGATLAAFFKTIWLAIFGA